MSVQWSQGEGRDVRVAKRIGPQLKEDLTSAGFSLGSPVFLRIFKEERELEIWIQKDGLFEKWRAFEVVGMSGELGPKLKEGDRQAPEGFYEVGSAAMNPKSRWHLSFNVGYPNAYDRHHGRTGSLIMVHGNRVSIGCFAMTDERIEEIYSVCDAALNAGQKSFAVHVFPFRMTEEKLKAHSEHRWLPFWQELVGGYRSFEKTKKVPKIRVQDGKYFLEKRD